MAAHSEAGKTTTGGLGRWKKTVLTLVQAVITIGLLYYVFHDPAKRARMITAASHANPLWLLAGIATYGLVEVLSGVRWQWLLRVQGITLSWWRVMQLTVIGLFFNFFIPGGTGGDVVKVFYLLKETPGQRVPALLSVLVDRIVGIIALAVLSGVLIGMRWSWLMSTPETARCVWPAIGILIFTLGGVHFSWVVTRHNLVHKLPAKFPGRDKLAELALAFTLYGRAWKPTVAAIGLSIVTHVGYFTVFYCAAMALRHEDTSIPSYVSLCTIMPIVNILAAMPLSINGLGVRENLFPIFLHRLDGVDEGVAAAIAFTGYVLTLVSGLIGGIFYLFYRPSEHARLSEIRSTVADLEHSAAEQEVAMEIAAKDKL